jgi:hypothetical protein
MFNDQKQAAMITAAASAAYIKQPAGGQLPQPS